MKKQLVFLVITSLFGVLLMHGQQKVYDLNLQNAYKQIKVGHLDFTGKSPDGTELGVNSSYFEKNGKPWFPLMGEFHYIRFPEKYWEEEILKMKSGGISIVATYVFWNAHESPKGTWDWTGIRDLRRFVALCAKHDMYVWLRVGPWSHGEQLYGGHPDWINSMKGKRSNDPQYLAECQKLLDQIGQQTKGLYFKNGGPIIGAQLENEFADGDHDHIKELKKMAIRAGIQPVYFSITANTVFNDSQYEAIPLQGSYPYRGWEKGGGKATKDFLFGDDQWILSESLGKVYYDATEYPKGMCEQGSGSQVTYQNRFIVEPHIVEAHLQNEIGRGMNMIGYYMFQGGTQLLGLEEPGCPYSYDFQAPIGEFGELRTSYKYLKILHNFVKDFGSDLAKTIVVEPKNPVRDENNTDQLRYVARALGNTGFLFLGNAQVRVPMPDKRFQIKLNLKEETLQFPRKEMLLKGETTAILPFNMEVNSALMKYATAQPIGRITKGKEQYLFLMQIPGMEAELAFDASTIKDISGEGIKKEAVGNVIFLYPQTDAPIKITAANGEQSTVVLLSRQEAENSWRLTIKGQESMVITAADLIGSKDQLEFRQLDNPSFTFKIFPDVAHPLSIEKKMIKSQKKGVLSAYTVNVSAIVPKLNITKKSKMEAVVSLPESLGQNLSDIFLEIDYLGAEADASKDNQKLTDHLFSGTAWNFGVKRFLNSKEKVNIAFKVKPWNDQIFGVSEQLQKEIKQSGSQIKGITVRPQYKIVVNL